MKIEEIETRYRITGDFHTHSVYSSIGPYRHAKGTIMDNVRAAHEKGLREIAITDHGPSDFYGLDIGRLEDMRADIAKAAEAFPDMKIYLGVEADIIDSENGLDVKPEDIPKFDFINAGYHYVPGSNMMANFASFRLRLASRSGIERLRRENTERIIRALTSNDVKILTHPGDKAYIDEEAVAAACEKTGTLIEINCRHLHPNERDLRIYAAHDLKFIISSDAHSADKVGRYARSLELAFRAGIDADRIVNIEER